MSIGRAASQLDRFIVACLRPGAIKPTISYALGRQSYPKSFSVSSPLAITCSDPSSTPGRRLALIHAQIHDALNADEHLPGKYPFSEDQIHRALGALARSGRPRDLSLIQQTLQNFTRLCGLSVVVETHDPIIRGLSQHGNPLTLLHWISQMRQKPGNVQPCLYHWHFFLQHCADTGHIGMIWTAISKMAYGGCPPNNRTFKILFEAMLNSGATAKDFYRAFDRIEKYTFWYDEENANLLYHGFLKLNRPQQALEVREAFNKRFQARVIKESPKLLKWEEGLELEVERHGLASAVKLCRFLEKEGYKIHHRTLSILLRRTHSVSDLEYAEKALNLKASPSHWSILITNATRAGDFVTAHHNYRQFLSTGLPLSAPLVQPLISALCETAHLKGADKMIDQALELYYELARALQPTLSNTMLPRGDPKYMRERSIGPDAYIYGTLFRAMGNAIYVKKYSGVAMTLLSEMEARSISPKNSVINTSLIVILMRCSSTPEEALGAYERFARGDDAPRLTTWGYEWILRTLSQLSFGDSDSLPPISHYFEIVKDMRLSGQAVTSAIYSQLLRRLATLAPDTPDDMRNHLAACVRRVHDHLTLDASLTPHVPLWNQLMDTYQRVGLFAEAYRVWEMLLAHENFDHASVSIILDACGFADAWPIAQKVRARLAERSFRFNQSNWDAYVECMCRVGCLNDAVKTVCLEMGRSQKDVAPNGNTVRMLLTFATRSNQQDEVLARIKQYLPDLWERLPSDLGGFIIKSIDTSR